MAEEPFLDYSRQFRRREPEDQPPTNMASPLDIGDGSARSPAPHNHRQLDEAFDAARWQPAKNPKTDSGQPITTVDTGNRIAVKASSIAFPPTNQFRFWVKAIPLNEDGTPQTSASAPGGWAEPVEYSSITGSGVTRTFVYEATSNAPKHRWLVSIPPQQATHGNAASNQLDIYVPREQ